MSRKSNGLGTVRKRPDGRYEGRYVGPDRKQHSVYAKTSRECAAKLRAAMLSADTGQWTHMEKITLGEWSDIYLRDWCGHVSPHTLAAYRCSVARIKKAIGSTCLSSVSVAHVRTLYSSLQEQGLSSGTLQVSRVCLSAMLNAAVKSSLLRQNPVPDVPLPKFKPVRDMNIIDRPMFPAFAAACRESPFGNEFMFMLITGLRVSECVGLTWSDVDLAQSVITVSHQLCYSKGAFSFIPTKSGKKRRIVIPPEAVAILRAQRVSLGELRLKQGADWYSSPVADDLVFRGRTGRPILLATIINAAHRLGAKIGVPALHPHDLRHSYAVAALRSGADVKTVQHNLGHATATMTLDVYARYTTDAGAAAARNLSDYLTAALKTGSN